MALPMCEREPLFERSTQLLVMMTLHALRARSGDVLLSPILSLLAYLCRNANPTAY